MLYGVGARLDEKPELLFQLRGVDESELLDSAAKDFSLAKAPPSDKKVLAERDVIAVFGLEMAELANANQPAIEPRQRAQGSDDRKISKSTSSAGKLKRRARAR